MQTVNITLITRNNVQVPVLANEITLERKRAGSPACLRFSVTKDEPLSFHEGDQVQFHFEGELVFSGFVFEKRRRYGGTIHVTAYDQIRYLKNRDTYHLHGQTAGDLVRRIGQDWNFKLGSIDETGYRLPESVEENRSLLDMIQDALDKTAQQTGDVFVLYDDAGSLCLNHVKDMALDILMDEGSIGDFDYSSTIDRDAYSAVSLHRALGNEGMRVNYETRHPMWMERWGMLRYYARAEDGEDGMRQAENLLKQYARKTRNLRIMDAVGDIRVRGGTLLPLQLNLGDILLDQFLMVERVTHRFRENAHTMELFMVGGDFRD